MCGIAGLIYRDGRPADVQVLQRMARALEHRGPDGQGARAFRGAGLAHRRLAIIDLSDAAAQPMGTEDGALWVSFNGEIYNYRALREELAALGHRFRTQSDTEVILHAFRAWGEGALSKLDGMFAFALWDEREKRLLLARDRAGKKPLFVYDDGDKVLFASEMKALLAHPEVDDALWEPAAPLYLTYGYVPTPGTFYRRIRRLPPASFQTFRLGGGDTPPARYWDYPVVSHSRGEQLRAATPGAVREAELRVRELFFEAVRKRLVADVPLGAFLSGGLDSTLVVGVMSELRSSPVKTFSIGFEGQPAYDETGYARIVADRFRTDHTEFKVQPESWQLLEKLAWHYDEPYGDSSAIPTYVVSKLTREHVKVALTGDGGDELFAGYPRFLAAQLAEALPRPAAGLLSSALRPFPGNGNGRSAFERTRRFVDRAALPLPDRFRAWNSYFQLDELPLILSPELSALAGRGTVAESYDAPLRRAREADLINRLLYLNASTYLLDDLNVKMDRASMAASLEARAPFLDTALMEYAFSLPGHLKLRGGTTKWLLRRAFKDLIPPEVQRRGKMGFGVPLSAWFRGELKGHLEDRLLPRSSALYPMLRREMVARMFQEHQAKTRDWSGPFWLLSMLELWLSGRAAKAAEARATSP